MRAVDGHDRAGGGGDVVVAGSQAFSQGSGGTLGCRGRDRCIPLHIGGDGGDRVGVQRGQFSRHVSGAVHAEACRRGCLFAHQLVADAGAAGGGVEYLIDQIGIRCVLRKAGRRSDLDRTVFKVGRESRGADADQSQRQDQRKYLLHGVTFLSLDCFSVLSFPESGIIFFSFQNRVFSAPDRRGPADETPLVSRTSGHCPYMYEYNCPTLFCQRSFPGFRQK